MYNGKIEEYCYRETFLIDRKVKHANCAKTIFCFLFRNETKERERGSWRKRARESEGEKQKSERIITKESMRKK